MDAHGEATDAVVTDQGIGRDHEFDIGTRGRDRLHDGSAVQFGGVQFRQLGEEDGQEGRALLALGAIPPQGPVGGGDLHLVQVRAPGAAAEAEVGLAALGEALADLLGRAG